MKPLGQTNNSSSSARLRVGRNYFFLFTLPHVRSSLFICLWPVRISHHTYLLPCILIWIPLLGPFLSRCIPVQRSLSLIILLHYHLYHFLLATSHLLASNNSTTYHLPDFETVCNAVPS